jgi:S1-C subfamily serine protease
MVPPREGLPHFEVAAGDLERGDWVVALGHPGGPYDDFEPTVTVGKVVEPRRRVPILFPTRKDYEPGVQSDAPLFGGNSGGPLVDLEGRLVGINGAILYVGDAGFTIPAARVRADLPRLRRGEDVEGDRIPFLHLVAAFLQLGQEVDPRELVEAYADSGFGLVLKALSALDAAGRPAVEKKGRRLADLRSAYGARAAAWGRTGRLREGERTAGFLCLWDREGGRARYVTSARLVAGTGPHSVVPPGGETAVEAEVLGRDGEIDLALLRTREEGAPDVAPPPLAPDPHPGAWVVLPGPDGTLYQGGAVAAVERSVGTDRRMSMLGMMGLFRPPNTSPFRPYPALLQIDPPLREDEFGGPVHRPDGSLVGIAVAHFHRACTFVLPAPRIAERVEALAGGLEVAAPPTYDPAGVPRKRLDSMAPPR